MCHDALGVYHDGLACDDGLGACHDGLACDDGLGVCHDGLACHTMVLEREMMLQILRKGQKTAPSLCNISRARTTYVAHTGGSNSASNCNIRYYCYYCPAGWKAPE